MSMPQELIDALIDRLPASDKRTLAHCALVCRTWRPRSQHRLFASLTLRGVEGRDPLPAFLDFLRTHPHLAGSVRTLHLLGGHPALDLSARWLASLLNTLPAVTALHIYAVDLAGLDRRYTPSARFRLAHLHIERTTTYREDSAIENLLEVLNLFDAIDVLHVQHSWAERMDWLSFDAEFTSCARLLPKHLRVKVLDIEDRPRPTRFWLDLMRTVGMPSLETLRVRGAQHDQIVRWDTLELLMSVCASSLRYVDLDFNIDGSLQLGAFPHDQGYTKLGLAHCTSLRTLILRLASRTSSSSSVRHWNALCAIVSTLAGHPMLRHIVIFYSFWVSGDTLDWDALRQPLERCAVLESVRFVDVHREQAEVAALKTKLGTVGQGVSVEFSNAWREMEAVSQQTLR